MSELVLAIAVVLVGECGPVGPSCQWEVARTMAARVESVQYPSTWEGVLPAYYGRGEPDATSMALARRVAYPGLAPAIPAGPYRYTYSDADMRRLGWRRGDLVLCAHGLCQHFSSDWPGGARSE